MRRSLTIAAAVLGAVVLLLVGAVVVRPASHRAAEAQAKQVTPLADGATADDLARTIDEAQARVAKVPDEWETWALLGLAYVQQARVTGDPAGYPRAQTALERSLAIHRDANTPALTGLGALAAARHDFAAALGFGQRAVEADPFHAAAHGVVADALVELGRYDEAYAAIQRMVDLRPDTGSYARASYAYELRGDVESARTLMQRALEVAPGRGDAAFACEHLANLVFEAGDPAGARSHVDEGLRRLPDHPPLLAVRARLRAAAGDAPGAVADYKTAVAKLPQPGYVADFGDLLASQGDAAGAEQQYALVRATAKLQAAQGVAVDLDLAVFAADHGDPAGALAAAQAGYPGRPSITGADALAWALHAGGRDAEALPYANQALRLGTRSALLYYHRGMIQAKLGHREQARADLSTALTLNPHFSVRHAPIARTTLASLGG